MIIGITGLIGAGKTSVVELLKEKGFEHLSVRDYINQELEKRNLEKNRDNMRVIANELRKKHGSSYIVEQLYQKSKGKVIIESIRTLGEVKALKNKKDFILLGITADPKTRYERIHKRKSSTDNVSFEEFKRQESLENNTSEDEQNLKICLKNADYTIENNGTYQELENKIKNLIAELDL